MPPEPPAATPEADLSKSIDALGRRMDDLRAALLFQAMGPDRIHEIVAFDTTIRMHLPQGAVDHVQRHILTTSTFFEMRQLNLVRPRVAPGAVVLDAGANIGNHALFFAMICRAAAVVAFEPQRSVFPILERNLALNGLRQVHAVNAALGARVGQAAIAQSRPGNLGATHFDLTGGGDYPVTTVDALGLERLDFVKIDVEGSQLAVIEGARDTLTRLKPMIWVELRPQLGEVEPGDTALQALGYRRAAALGRNDHLYLPA